jgi:hypothetical protein
MPARPPRQLALDPNDADRRAAPVSGRRKIKKIVQSRSPSLACFKKRLGAPSLASSPPRRKRGPGPAACFEPAPWSRRPATIFAIDKVSAGKGRKIDAALSAPRSNDVSSEQATHTASEQELAQARAKADLLVALYANVTQDLEQSTRERDGLRGELAEARNEIQRLNDELVRGAARATEQQQRHDALLNSTSWRVTAPLRALARLIGRGS